MAVYTNLPVYEECYQLFLKFARLSIKMQRDYRYSLGEDVKRLLMSMILGIYKANYKTEKKDRVDAISNARERLVELQVILRLLNELRQIPDRHYMIMVEQTVKCIEAIGRVGNKNKQNNT